MIGKSYWGLAAPVLILLTFALMTGCSSTVATPPPVVLNKVTAQAPFAQNAVVNSQFASTLSVVVTDNTGTPLQGINVTFTAPAAGAGGTFANGSSSTGASTDVNGLATSSAFTANGTVGTYLVIASAQTTQATVMFNMANTLQPGAISVGGGSPQSTTTGTQFQNAFTVNVKDSTGTKAPGVNLPVTFTSNDPGGDGYFTDTDGPTTTALTNASGVATSAPYVAGSTVGGLYTVTASTVDGDPATATFTVSNTIKPATITATAGDAQTATVSTPFATNLQVTVLDGSATPVPVADALVTFTAPGSGASGTFADTGTATTQVWTDSNGVATAPAFTANSTSGGPYNVSASVVVQSGTSLSVNFALTNQ